MARPKTRFQFCKYGHDMYILGTDPENRCSECGRIRHNEYRMKNKEKVNLQSSRHKWLRRYGLTPLNYDDLLSKQEGKCAICKNVPKEDKLKRTFHIDHCHSTGIVRGLLCSHCNLMLGFAKDNSEILKEAIVYLG